MINLLLIRMVPHHSAAATARNNKEWRCIFGLHVRTATFIIGMWHLFLNILAIGLLAIIIRNPAMMNDFDNGLGIDDDDESLPTPLSKVDVPAPLSKIDQPYAYRANSNYENIDMGGLVCLCMIAITLMMIYGTIKGKASHLLPFFFLQLFDFAITTLTAAGYICYLRTIHHLISESSRLPWKEEIIKMDPRSLSILVLFAFICIVLLKGYAIGVVFRCYKYLTLRQHNVRSMLPYIIPDSNMMNPERAYSSLLPDYEECLKQCPPPTYQVALQQQNLQQITSITVDLPAEVLTPSPGSPNLGTEGESSTDEIPPPAYNTVVVDQAVVAQSENK